MRTEFNDIEIFSDYTELLEDLDATPEDAADRMWEICETQVTNYTAEYIQRIFELNLIANEKKYEDLAEFFEWEMHPFWNEYETEEYRHQRTPDLESKSVSRGSGSADSTRNQTLTTTSTPGVQTTTTHSVNPYDNTGLRSESSDLTSETGYDTTTQAYSGQPDHTENQSQASATVTTTGTDQNEYEKKRLARKGTTSEIIADGFKAASMRDVLDIIINDLAEQIFLQMWI